MILEQNAQGYQVLESFAYVRTPVYVSDAMSDGWHDLIFPAHGGEEGTGFRVFHYQDSVGFRMRIWNSWMTWTKISVAGG